MTRVQVTKDKGNMEEIKVKLQRESQLEVTRETTR